MVFFFKTIHEDHPTQHNRRLYPDQQHQLQVEEEDAKNLDAGKNVVIN